MKSLHIICLIFINCTILKGQEGTALILKTKIANWTYLNPNIELEKSIGKKISITLDAGYKGLWLVNSQGSDSYFFGNSELAVGYNAGIIFKYYLPYRYEESLFGTYISLIVRHAYKKTNVDAEVEKSFFSIPSSSEVQNIIIESYSPQIAFAIGKQYKSKNISWEWSGGIICYFNEYSEKTTDNTQYAHANNVEGYYSNKNNVISPFIKFTIGKIIHKKRY